ncbi:MAG: RHS repeat-associated core domain-containing protein, partial [Candidatus Woesearchaeota archaeon]
YSPTGEIITGGNKSRYTYEGKEYDKTTGQTDFNFRMLNPGTNQFIQPDTVVQNVYDPQDLNRYSFEANNPMKNTDPTGHYVETAIDVAFIALDIAEIKEDPTDWKNWAALGLDLATTALPVAAGGSMLIKGGDRINTVRHMVSNSDRVKDTATSVSRSADIKQSSNLVKTSKGDFTLSNEASKRMVERSISKADIAKTIDKSDPISYYKGGSGCVAYYCPSTKVLVPTNPKTKNIITVFKARASYVQKLFKGGK